MGCMAESYETPAGSPSVNHFPRGQNSKLGFANGNVFESPIIQSQLFQLGIWVSETNQHQTRCLSNCIMEQMHLYFRPERYYKFPICNLGSTKRTEDRGYMHGLGIYVIRRIIQRPFPTTTSRVCAIPIGQLTEVAPACGKRLALPLPQWVRNIITNFSLSIRSSTID